MKASIEALKSIAKEMKKKGVEKISMVGKSDPKTVGKLEAMGESSKESDPEMESEEENPMEEKVEALPEDSDLQEKLELIKQLLGKV